jgi:ferredoxin
MKYWILIILIGLTTSGLMPTISGLDFYTPLVAEARADTVIAEDEPHVHRNADGDVIIEWICPMECGDLRFKEPAVCPLCNMDVVPHRVRRAATAGDPVFMALAEGGFFDPDHLLGEAEVVVDRPARALMPGVPNLFFYVGTGAIVLLTFLLIFVLGEPRRNMSKTSSRWDYARFELTRWAPVRRFVKWRGFQPAVQLPVVLLFLLVIAAGLFGSQDPSRNIAPVLTWNIWWMGLIFFAFFAGEIWCTVCPWMALPDWVKRLSAKLPGRNRPVGLERRWPKVLQNLYPAILGFIALSWIELAYEAPYRPALTAVMGLAMVGLAAATLFVFERKGFCRYLCPVGRVTGAYGTTGMLEIRRKDGQICKDCRTKDCFHGNERGLPCPTHEFMGAMNENSYCTMCTECLKTCPHDNIGLNVRVPLADLMGPHRKRRDEAWLLLVIFVISIFHGLAMIPVWTHDTIPPLRDGLEGLLGFDVGYLWTFTLAMTAFIVGSIALYVGACAVMKLASGNLFYRLKDYFIAYAYPLLPVALAYHLAHNALHFFYEGSKLVRLLSDPFGWGWNLFGTAQSPLTMLVPIQYIWVTQIALVLVGNVAAVWLVNRTAHRMFGNRRQALRAVFPMVLFVALLSVAALWLLSQPMEMRTA